MLIECRQRREPNHRSPKGGTELTLFNRRYHFRPQPDLLKGKFSDCDPEMHICEVNDEKAIERLLAIPEGYNKVGAPPQLPTPPVKIEAQGQPPITTELIDDDDTLGTPDVDDLDPLALAKREQIAWIEDMLARNTKEIKSAPFKDLDDGALGLFIEMEANGLNRSTVIGYATKEQEARQAPPPADDNVDIE